MFDFINICRALSDENRVRILMALRGRKLCVCQITAFLDLAPSTTSKHLSILRQARLIESRKNGRWVYYQLAESARTSQAVREALVWMRQNLERDAVLLEDEARMAAILESEKRSGLCPEDAERFHSPELHVQDPDDLMDDTGDTNNADSRLA